MVGFMSNSPTLKKDELRGYKDKYISVVWDWVDLKIQLCMKLNFFDPARIFLIISHAKQQKMQCTQCKQDTNKAWTKTTTKNYKSQQNTFLQILLHYYIQKRC